MCISGSHVTMVKLAKPKGIKAARRWRLISFWNHGKLSWTLGPMHYSGRPKTWLKKYARSDRHPPKNWNSDKGLHALPLRRYNAITQADDSVSGSVLLFGVVAVHRTGPTGRTPLTGYRSSAATVLSLDLDPRRSDEYKQKVISAAERLGVPVIRRKQ